MRRNWGRVPDESAARVSLVVDAEEEPDGNSAGGAAVGGGGRGTKRPRHAPFEPELKAAMSRSSSSTNLSASAALARSPWPGWSITTIPTLSTCSAPMIHGVSLFLLSPMFVRSVVPPLLALLSAVIDRC